MIAHVSLPSKNPQHAARFFAALIDGLAYEFPVVAGAWIAVAKDQSGLAIEVYPESMAHHPGTGEADPTVSPATPQTMPWEDQIYADGNHVRPSAFHLALFSSLQEADVLRLAQKAGWRALKCERAGVFGVVEVWVDNTILVEVLNDPELRRYRHFMRPEVCGDMFGKGFAPEVRTAS